MFGGTPTNIALSLLEAGRVEVITGVNLPVLLKFVGHRADKPLDELARLLREYGRSSIVLATDMLKEKK
jgi:PTS system mannose-specific IIA component